MLREKRYQTGTRCPADPSKARGWNCVVKIGGRYNRCPNRAVVQIRIANMRGGCVDGIADNFITMILRGDVGTVAVQILDRLGCAVMTKMHFLGFCAKRECDKLVTKAHAKHRHTAFCQFFLTAAMISVLSAGSPGPPDSITPSKPPARISCAPVWAGTGLLHSRAPAAPAPCRRSCRNRAWRRGTWFHPLPGRRMLRCGKLP